MCARRWDQTLKLFGDQAIIVYPQSTGDPYSRQFFNVQFWWVAAVVFATGLLWRGVPHADSRLQAAIFS